VAREKGVFVRSLTDPSENHNVIPEDLSNYKVARGGDLVINKMKAWQGSMGIAPCDGIVSPAYYVFEFGIENAGFGQKLLRSKPYVAHFGQASDGVRVGQWDLSIPGMRLIPVLVPPPAEQSAIVRFLDHWNGRLEKASRSKRRVIALLQEQKQAIIHRAVTRGLDPNVKLKDSGILWLGEIPAHWDLRNLRQLLTARARRGRPDLPLLSVVREKGVIVRDMDNLEANHNFIHDDLSNYKVVHAGQFAMNKMKAWQGSYGVSAHTGIVSPAYFIFDLREVEGSFFHTALRSKAYVPFFTQASDGIRVGQWDLNQSRMRNIPFYFPEPDDKALCQDRERQWKPELYGD
jgi:type I restriction enzyme S subunit